MKKQKCVLIGKGGQKIKEIDDVISTIMAAWYGKSTYASRPTPYIIEEDKEQESTIFLGNYYGFHDGYDGSVFSAEGVAPTVLAAASHIHHIMEKVDE